ncbi:MAG: DUF4252 domain-containing protein [Chitinophagaceae bacterium]|jgi:hypothetical protein|nr:DUF4252 domain-containing protein [Chitinophagaceae bacterium]
MKKNIILSLLLAAITTSAFAQNSLTNFIDKYRKMENVTYMKLGRFPLSLALTFNKDARQAGFKIYSLEVLSFERGASQQENTRREMAKLLSDLMKEGYDELMYAKDKGDKVHILGKLENDTIVKDCILLTTDNENETSIVHLTGKLNLNQITNLDKTWVVR